MGSVRTKPSASRVTDRGAARCDIARALARALLPAGRPLLGLSAVAAFDDMLLFVVVMLSNDAAIATTNDERT